MGHTLAHVIACPAGGLHYYQPVAVSTQWHCTPLQIIHDLTVHSLAEEEVLYPEMKNYMGTEVG